MSLFLAPTQLLALETMAATSEVNDDKAAHLPQKLQP
jgi:hypothetical protein